MFQYAAARRLAHIHKTELILDLSWFNRIAPGVTVRKFELGPLNVDFRPALPGETTKFRGAGLFGKIKRRVTRNIRFLNRRYLFEKYYHFDPSVLTMKDNVYLEGYWQSYRYFADIEEIIRREFTVRKEPDAVNCDMAEKISRTLSVSVHIRRGDYLLKAGSHMGLCGIDYYLKAVKVITAQVNPQHFYVFSDDPEWARQNIDFLKPVTVVDHNGTDTAYEDLRLMSLCKHHIIANSSLSWWGAWLSKYPEKIVVAPKQWFNNEKRNTSDLIPKQWMRI